LALALGGTYDIPLMSTETAPGVKGKGRLVFAASPFGVAVTGAGVASYDVQLDVEGLPAPATLGEYSSYVVWAASIDLAEWHRLGTVRNGRTTVGRIELNKFMLVITAESDSLAEARTGPTILHGHSPSTWLQSFLTHPPFKSIPPG